MTTVDDDDDANNKPAPTSVRGAFDDDVEKLLSIKTFASFCSINMCVY